MKKIDFVTTGAGVYYGVQLKDSQYGQYGIGLCGDSAELNALAFNAITGAGFISSEKRENKLASAIKSLFSDPESARIEELNQKAKGRLKKIEALSVNVIAGSSVAQKQNDREQI